MFKIEVSNGVATVVLERPPVNAINRQWAARFHELLDQLERRDDWNVLHIRSALRIFSAGADIKEMQTVFNQGGDVGALVSGVRDYQRLFARIENLPRITLAEIGGSAMGGGFELALSCDLRIVADEARVGLPEIRLGLLPGAGGTQRLTRLCGRATALRIIAGAKIVDGQAAVQLGMAHWNFPLNRLREEGDKIARHYAGQHGLAGRLAKNCINAATNPVSAQGLDLEYEGSKTLLESAESQALIKKFLAGRKSNDLE